MYSKISDPHTNKKYNLNSKKGKEILKRFLFSYKNQFGGEEPMACEKSIEYFKKNCNQGTCWDGYVQDGMKTKNGKLVPNCISESKECKKQIICSTTCKDNTEFCSNNSDDYNSDDYKPDSKTINSYKKCIDESKYRFCGTNKDEEDPWCNDWLNTAVKPSKQPKNLNLCPTGYCAAKHKYDVYPSAYANIYASKVCKGELKSDFDENHIDIGEINSYNKKLEKRKKNNSTRNLSRWFKEKWVNVCEPNDSTLKFKACGTSKGVHNLDNYPYCRPYYHLEDSTPVSVEEILKYYPDEADDIFSRMCSEKRSLEQGVDGKPTYVRIEESFSDIIEDIKNKRKENR